MAVLEFTITSPSPNRILGRTLTVSGRAKDRFPKASPRNRVDQVTVRLSDIGPEVHAALAADGSWTCQGTIPDDVPAGSAVTLLATAGCMEITTLTDEEHTEVQRPFTQQTSVMVILDGTSGLAALLAGSPRNGAR
jgi:hypothetical protein